MMQKIRTRNSRRSSSYVPPEGAPNVLLSADDGCDVGEDGGAPVSPDYGPRGNAFNGRVKGVQLAIADAAENSDHLISPEEAVRIATARQ
jgi:hypothetical protein